MKNFQIIAHNIDVAPLLVALENNSNLWNQFPIRTMHNNSPHTEVDDILIRFNPPSTDREMWDNTKAEWYPANEVLPVHNIIYGLMAEVLGEQIGRVIITKMKPNTKIKPHKDMGSPATFYQRFHVTLKNSPGAVFKCGDEEFTPNVGDIFIFNNTEEHSVENNSSEDRITMIVDIRTPWLEHIKPTRTEDFTVKPADFTHTKGDVTYTVDNFANTIPEFRDFLQLHWEELAVSKEEVPLDFDWQRFVDMEAQGKLHTVTIRKNNVLIGYHVSLIGGHLHYKSTPHAIVDLYYVLPQHRGNGIGLGMFKFVEASLKQMGIVKIITGTKLHKDNGELFKHLGYNVCDNLYYKILNK